MKDKMGIKRRSKGRWGPVGFSVVAATLTAAALAAVSVAQDGGVWQDSGDKRGDGGMLEGRAPGPGGPHVFTERIGEDVITERIGEEDRQALEKFRRCMEDNGAPAPPEPGSFEPGDGPPEPPSEEDRAIERGLEACESKLPEGAHGFGPAGPGGPGCGPPPGVAPNQGDSGEQQAAPQGSST